MRRRPRARGHDARRRGPRRRAVARRPDDRRAPPDGRRTSRTRSRAARRRSGCASPTTTRRARSRARSARSRSPRPTSRAPRRPATPPRSTRSSATRSSSSSTAARRAAARRRRSSTARSTSRGSCGPGPSTRRVSPPRSTRRASATTSEPRSRARLTAELGQGGSRSWEDRSGVPADRGTGRKESAADDHLPGERDRDGVDRGGRPRAVGRDAGGAPPPARQDRAHRERELRLRGRDGGAGQLADQQVRRGPAGQALLRRLRVRGHRRAARPGAGARPVPGRRARQRAAPFRGAGQHDRLLQRARAG